MRNHEIATVLYEIADLLEMKEIEYKPRAYRNAAQSIETLGMDVEQLYKQGKLRSIPGVGKALEIKIIEYLETGKIKKLKDLQREMPIDIQALSTVEGLGLKRIDKLYHELGIENLDDLEDAAKKGKIENVGGFGKKTQKTILENISFARKSRDRYLLGFVEKEATKIVELLTESVDTIQIAGSLRRRKETIGDVDVLVMTAKPEQVIDTFVNMYHVEKVLALGDTKSSVRLFSGLQVDLRIVENESFGSALQYFTGSKEHNIEVRKIALKHRYKLNEYGLFENGAIIAGATEEEVYAALGMEWIPPELRENRGEVQAALNNSLPHLIHYDDVCGDFQMHTNWSDGNNSIAEMVAEAKKIGHAYIAITDHVGSLKIAGSMDKTAYKRQAEAVEAARKEYKEIHIFHGLEANIMRDGTIDVEDALLESADVVLASIHSAFRLDKKIMTQRLIAAIEHPLVNIIAHPTCRMIQKREPVQFDMEQVLQAAKDNKVVLEINAFPERLDLNDINVKMAVEAGVKLSIGTDAHDRDHLRYCALGVAVARRGWASKDDIINTYTVQQLRKLFGKNFKN